MKRYRFLLRDVDTSRLAILASKSTRARKRGGVKADDDAGRDPEEEKKKKTKRRDFWCSSVCPTKQRERELVRGDPRNRSSRRRRKPLILLLMFFHVRREKNVVLEPRHFGARMKDVIMEKIKLEVRPVCCMRSRVFSSHYLLYFVSFSLVQF